MEFLEGLSQLGFPGWFLIAAAALLLLHYTGILKKMGTFFSSAVSGNQELMALLQAKALDQNSLLIDFVTDRLMGSIESLEEGQKETVTELGEIRGEIKIILHDLDGRKASREALRLIGDLQDKQAMLEGRLLSSMAGKSSQDDVKCVEGN